MSATVHRAGPPAGLVSLVGAGPGDLGLLTVRGLRRLQQADVVVYDHLVHGALLELAPPEAERIYVGKWAGHRQMSQRAIEDLLVERARRGQRVVRLKGGDPFLYGRGGEEADRLRGAGVPFEVVSGVTSAIAVPAAAGIPVTDRRMASSVAVLTGHEDPTRPDARIDWQRVATATDTLVVLMGTRRLADICARLVAGGRPADTPAAVVASGTLAAQRVVRAPLAEIADAVARAEIEPPTVLVVGAVAALADRCGWRAGRPLAGVRILLTRPRAQSLELAARLADLGGEPIVLPAIEVVPPDDWTPVDRAIAALEDYDTVLFTSANGVAFFFQRLLARGGDARRLHTARVVAIGPATARRLREYGVVADLVPDEYRAEGLVAALQQAGSVAGSRMLLPRAHEAREVLPEAMRAAGAHIDVVPVYRTVTAQGGDPDAVRAMLEAGRIDVLMFTSSSTVRRTAERVGDAALLRGQPAACIGPITAATARRYGLQVVVQPQAYTEDGLVDALCAWARNRRERA